MLAWSEQYRIYQSGANHIRYSEECDGTALHEALTKWKSSLSKPEPEETDEETEGAAKDLQRRDAERPDYRDKEW